jgi:hypothetical protein
VGRKSGNHEAFMMTEIEGGTEKVVTMELHVARARWKKEVAKKRLQKN